MGLNRQAFCFLLELKLNWVKRNSRSEIFSEKTLLKMFLNFTRQQLYRIIYFNNLPGCRPTTISAETLRYWWIFRHFCKFKIFLEGNFYKNTCKQLLFNKISPVLKLTRTKAAVIARLHIPSVSGNNTLWNEKVNRIMTRGLM